MKRGLTYTALSKGSNYTILDTDQKALIAANASTASFTITLPLASNAGFTTTIKKVDNSVNTVTVKGNGTETIDGVNTFVLQNYQDSVELISTGTEWIISSVKLSRVGLIDAFGGPLSNLPSRTLPCDGTEFSRTGDTAQLFAKIGTIWGVGNGSTTANLPLFNNGYFLRAISVDSTIDPDGPRGVATTQLDAFQGHHMASFPGSGFASFSGSGLQYGGGPFGQSNSETGNPITDGVNGTPRTSRETRSINKTVAFVINY